MQPTKSPNSDMPAVVSRLLSDSTDASTNAITMVAKYSVGPNINETCASTGDNVATMTKPTHPATNDPIAAIASAGPARPLRAIGWPSMQITTELGSPGMLSMIAVVEPAMVPRHVDPDHDWRRSRKRQR